MSGVRIPEVITPKAAPESLQLKCGFFYVYTSAPPLKRALAQLELPEGPLEQSRRLPGTRFSANGTSETS